MSTTKQVIKKNNNQEEILSRNKLYDFFIFNKSGICILEKQLEILFEDITEYNNYKLLIKNISHLLLINIKENKEVPKQKADNQLVINKVSNNNGGNFRFQSIQNEKCKITFLIINNIVLVGTFPHTSSTQFQRLLLIHIFVALFNFKGDLIPIIEKMNESEEYDKNNFINLKTYYNKNLNVASSETNDFLEILIFEYYFLKSLIIHFSKVFNEMFKKEYLHLKQTKFKNLYILDINSSKVILDMCKIQGNKNNQKNKKYYKFEKLFDEIIYHSKNMYNSYIRENDMKYTSSGADFRFVKFECTSTYPRLLFIIKFIPVLKGIAIIHLYSQKKLSRNNENNIQSEQGINCKEVDLLFGSFIKDNPNFEFKYGAPKKLNYIEKFIEEFFITNRNDMGIFRLNNSDKKFKYVNYYVINIINNYQILNNTDIDQIFNDFNKKLEEEYEKDQKNKEKNKNEGNDNESNNEESENETKTIDNILILNKESFYNDFFNKNISKNKNNNINNKNKRNNIININSENRSLISKEDEEKKNLINENNNNNINQNLNINDLVNTNSERNNLLKIEDNFNLSVNNSRNAIHKTLISKNSQFDNNSLISEIKSNEKFELKDVNVKENEEKANIEDTKEKLSDKSFLNEKEFKLNELLELISMNKKNRDNKSENNEIKDEAENYELNNQNNSSKLNQNSSSNKKRVKLTITDKDKDPGSGTSRNSLIKHN